MSPARSFFELVGIIKKQFKKEHLQVQKKTLQDKN